MRLGCLIYLKRTKAYYDFFSYFSGASVRGYLRKGNSCVFCFLLAYQELGFEIASCSLSGARIRKIFGVGPFPSVSGWWVKNWEPSWVVGKVCGQPGEYGTPLMVWWGLGFSPGRNWCPEGWLLHETSSARGDFCWGKFRLDGNSWRRNGLLVATRMVGHWPGLDLKLRFKELLRWDPPLLELVQILSGALSLVEKWEWIVSYSTALLGQTK